MRGVSLLHVESRGLTHTRTHTHTHTRQTFGNKLAIKEDWSCTDMPYFDAPGALVAPLGTRVGGSFALPPPAAAAPGAAGPGALALASASHDDGGGGGGGGGGDADSSGRGAYGSPLGSAHACGPAAGAAALAAAGSASGAPPPAARGRGYGSAPRPGFLLHSIVGGGGSAALPNVTLVFACVDGAKNFIKRRRSFADEVHQLLSTLMREALRHVPGGYLCREQEGWVAALVGVNGVGLLCFYVCVCACVCVCVCM